MSAPATPDRRDRLTEFLTGEGFRPSFLSNGDIKFQYEGGTYGIRFDENDDQYLALIFPNFWTLKTDEDVARAIRAANRATKRLRAVKVTVFEDTGDVWASIEVLSEGTGPFEAVFYRHLRQLQAGAHRFTEEWRALAPASEPRLGLPLGEVTRFQNGN